MPDVRPIDANALIAEFEIMKKYPKNTSIERVCLNAAMSVIDYAPNLDYAPVRHERWKAISRQEAKNYAPLGIVFCDDNFICTGCGHFEVFNIASRRHNYCPNCGAVMDGGEKDV